MTIKLNSFLVEILCAWRKRKWLYFGGDLNSIVDCGLLSIDVAVHVPSPNSKRITVYNSFTNRRCGVNWDFAAYLNKL